MISGALKAFLGIGLQQVPNLVKLDVIVEHEVGTSKLYM